MTWALRAAGLYGRGQRNAAQVRRRDLVLRPRGLAPGLDGLRIFFAADFHFAASSRVPPARQLLDGASCDLLILGGDFLWGFSQRWQHVAPMLEAFLEGLEPRLGSYAVLGNHDFAAFAQSFAEFGVRTLLNEAVPLRFGGAPLWLVGTDDPTFFKTHDPRLALQGVAPGEPILFVCHGPELAQAAARAGASLYLCGHTHWGQVRLPWVGSLTYNSEAPKRYCRGMWKVDGMTGYTTAGLGVTELPVRLGCPPEAALITLRQP